MTNSTSNQSAYVYSPSTECFYATNLNYPDIPSDAIDVTADQFAAAMARGPGDTLSVVDGVVTVVPYAGPTLAQAQTTQTAALAAACQAAIYKGFTSSALGVANTYPTDDKSQFNLTASVTDSLLPNLPANWTTPFMCADSSGVWAMRPHTAAQIQQAGSDGKAFILKNLQQNASLAAQVAAATTVAAVQAIIWTNPA